MQADLFAAPVVSGIALVPNLIDPDCERDLIALIDASGLSPFRFQGWEGKRLTASFGPSYDFDRGRVELGRPIPDALLPVRTAMADFAGISPCKLVQTLLIRYDPGAGIGWHRDRPQFDCVVGLSLGSDAQLRLRRRRDDGFARTNVHLPVRSAYLLTGEVRHDWERSIAPLKETRWSITFRSLSDLGQRSIA